MIDVLIISGLCALPLAVFGLIIGSAIQVSVWERRNERFAKSCLRVAEEQPDWKADKKCGACEGGNHEDCSGWCFCPLGPCDRGPSR